MVKKYKTLLKLQWRMISKTKSRFLSILVITFIGAAFFAGLRVSPIVMEVSTDAYLDNQHYADLTLIPTYGVTTEDINEIEKLDGIEKVEGMYFFDAELEINKDYDGMVVYSYSENFNTPYIIDGRLIEEENECLIDEQYQKARGLKIGDEITLRNDNTTKSFEIVGIVKDPRFILYYKRGTNAYGNGTSQGFVIVDKIVAKDMALNKDLVELLGNDDFYNEALIKVYDADSMNLFGDEYDATLNRVEADIDELMSVRLNKTYQTLIKDKNDLLKEPIEQYEKGLKEYETGLATFNTQISEAELQIVEGRIALLEGKKQLVAAQGQFSGMEGEVDEIITGFQSDLDVLYNQLEKLKEEMNQPTEPNPDIVKPDITLPEIENPVPEVSDEDLNETIDAVSSSIKHLNETLSQVNELATGLLQLQEAQLEIDKAEIELDVGEQQLAMQKELGKQELDKAKKQLDEAKILIDDAKAQIDLIPKGEYYLLDQNMNEGVASFAADAERIGIIAQMFPLMFFLVSALVCLTTMTRMVEEQRSQSGTLRALGYSRLMIIMQYVVYAIVPTLIGSIVGYFFGALLFPYVIYTLYTMMMYDVPQPMIYIVDQNLVVLSITIAVCVTLMATLFSCVKEMSSVPAVLMRPKAPKIGKRILLERWTWLWKKMSFNQKVTMRNIFRYKKRFLMSVIGIAGCSGLILAGYGIRYSILEMSTYQYEELSLYDGSVTYQENYVIEDTLALRDDIKKNKDVTEILFVSQSNTQTHAGDKAIDTFVFIPSSTAKLNRFLVLRDYKTKEALEFSDSGAIITVKLSEMLDVGIGDEVEFTYNNQTYMVVVSDIAENYIGHYIYMSPEYGSSVFGKEIGYNSACFNIDNTSETLEDQIGKNLMKLNNVASVSFMRDAGGTIVTQLNSVGVVTNLLTISAGILAFVVLYNLTNININERITEIATIKVLGFRDKEVYDYVFRENIMLSAIGTFVGLFFGYWMHQSIMLTVEVDLIMFVRSIKPISYLYAISFTMIFTLFINRFMQRVLDRVDMVTSLKSVE